MEEYITIEEDILSELVEKKSKFITNFIHVTSQKEAKEKIDVIRKKYHDARHNCYAYRIIEDNCIKENLCDDGEPSGTAGAPMLNILEKNNLVNCVVIVTRYFGGILLGTGGLVRAYSNSLLLAIDNSKKVNEVFGDEFEIIVDYAYLESFKYYCKNNCIKIVDTIFKEEIICKIDVQNVNKNKLLEDFKNKKILLKSIKWLCKKNFRKI